MNPPTKTEAIQVVPATAQKRKLIALYDPTFTNIDAVVMVTPTDKKCKATLKLRLSELLTRIETTGMPPQEKHPGYTYKKWQISKLGLTNLPTVKKQKVALSRYWRLNPGDPVVEAVKRVVMRGSDNSWLPMKVFGYQNGISDERLESALVFANPAKPLISTENPQAIDYRRRVSDGTEFCRVNPFYINEIRIAAAAAAGDPPSPSRQTTQLL